MIYIGSYNSTFMLENDTANYMDSYATITTGSGATMAFGVTDYRQSKLLQPLKQFGFEIHSS